MKERILITSKSSLNSDTESDLDYMDAWAGLRLRTTQIVLGLGAGYKIR